MKLEPALRRAVRAKPSGWRRHDRLVSRWPGGAAALAGNQPLASAWYFSDAQGNVAALVYTNLAVPAQYAYDPFGNLLAASAPLAGANRYRFSSKEWEPNAGLYYYGYRFYDPNLQRWLNRDPLGEAGGYNLYEYALNNPNTFCDPQGLSLARCLADTVINGAINAAEDAVGCEVCGLVTPQFHPFDPSDSAESGPGLGGAGEKVGDFAAKQLANNQAEKANQALHDFLNNHHSSAGLLNRAGLANKTLQQQAKLARNFERDLNPLLKAASGWGRLATAVPFVGAGIEGAECFKKYW